MTISYETISVGMHFAEDFSTINLGDWDQGIQAGKSGKKTQNNE